METLFFTFANDPDEADQLYDGVIRYGYRGCTIATFFGLCRDRGVTFKTQSSLPTPPTTFDRSHLLRQLRDFFLSQDIPPRLRTASVQMDNLHSVILAHLRIAETSRNKAEVEQALVALVFIRSQCEVVLSGK